MVCRKVHYFLETTWTHLPHIYLILSVFQVSEGVIRIAKRIHIGLIAAASLLLAATVVWGFIWNYAQLKTVPEHVQAGSLPLGGMHIDDALTALRQYEQALEQRTLTVRIESAGSEWKQWTLSELGYKAEFADARNALLKLGEGDMWERALYRFNFEKKYAMTQSWNRDTLDAAVRKQWSWIEKNAPQNAARTITDDDRVIYEPHVDAYRLDTAPLLASAEQWVLLEEEQIGAPVQHAFEAVLPVKVIQPELTLEKLMEEGIERKIIEFSTDFRTSAEGRAHNVTVTAEALHNWQLAPDEIFDYSKLIARAEELYEYREAPVILNGKLVPGIGGGICQVSSTLYNAALRAGLTIVERRNHSLPVAYLPIGQDATYAGGAINFRFKNTTGKHLLIRTEVKDRVLTVKLFGTMDDSDRYEVESVTVKTIDPPVKERISPALSPGQRVTVEAGRAGYVVDTYRTHLRDGKVIAREKVSRDTYKAQPVIIETGAKTGKGEASPAPEAERIEPLLEDGL
ncbi:Vancomycin B-type resistance protein VanW [compost metagenome]